MGRKFEENGGCTCGAVGKIVLHGCDPQKCSEFWHSVLNNLAPYLQGMDRNHFLLKNSCSKDVILKSARVFFSTFFFKHLALYM